MPDSQIVPKHQKERIIKILSQDNHQQLIKFLNKEIISADK
jgi:hypothetical protein